MNPFRAAGFDGGLGDVPFNEWHLTLGAGEGDPVARGKVAVGCTGSLC